MRQIALFLIGLFFGGGLGFLLAAGMGVTLDGHDHSDPLQHAGADHHAEPGAHAAHPPIELPEGPEAPRLAARLLPDAKGGWNLQLEVENFRFAPERVNTAHRPGEGHAHVYVDGRKVARLYGPWMHIESLSEGATVTVELNANDHSPLAVGGKPIRVDLVVPAR